ncbi:MAG: hypothetical protein JNL39_16240 [Opitutaceae bacterium]|nr:hypothetical protein [Opitutaceae bacterium]
MRFSLLGILLTFALTAPAIAAEAEFVRVWPGWRDAASFDRIREYFGGEEASVREPILRTQPATREGYYFLVRVKSAAQSAAKIAVSVIRPDHPEAKVFTFPFAPTTSETALNVGLTGADWPGGKAASPVAWKIALLAADGRVLAEHKSFLWEKPAK